MVDYKNKDYIGIIFFALSIIFLAYMFITPLNNLVGHIDEYFTMNVVVLPVHDILSVNTWDVHPPLHYFMGKAVSKLCAMLGMDLLYGLKILSIIPYILILIVSATKIRKDYGLLAAGLFAFSLVACSEFFRYYLIARMYSWAIFFVLMCFIFFKEIIDKSDRKYWILLTIFAVLAAYTHYFAAVSAGCIYLILLAYIVRYRKEDIKNWGLSVIAAIILYSPWIPSLINQLSNVHESFWIPEVTGDKTVLFFGYFVYNEGDLLIAILGIAILAVLLFIYAKEYKNLDKKDQMLILSGIGVYFGTIILGIIISVVFKPILVTRYLMPAAAVLWLTLSIIISKIENQRMFIIAFALICLLFVSGVASIISTNESVYQSGMEQKEVLDNITRDNNSMVIIPSKTVILWFLDISPETDLYCLNVGHVYGVNMDRLHKLYDFKNINGTEINDLVNNNTDKNIYIISWNEPPKLDYPTELINQNVGLEISKVNMANATNNNV